MHDITVVNMIQSDLYLYMYLSYYLYILLVPFFLRTDSFSLLSLYPSVSGSASAAPVVKQREFDEKRFHALNQALWHNFAMNYTDILTNNDLEGKLVSWLVWRKAMHG